MSGIARRLPVVAAVLAVAACAAQRADTTDADVTAITRAANEWGSAVQAGNLDQIQAAFTSDIVLLPPNEPAVEGAEATHAWGKALVDAVTMTSTGIVPDETVVSGDWAFTRGVFRATMQPKGGGPAVPQANKYILIWRRQADGSWKIARDIWNGSEPPPPAAAAPTTR